MSEVVDPFLADRSLWREEGL